MSPYLRSVLYLPRNHCSLYGCECVRVCVCMPVWYMLYYYKFPIEKFRSEMRIINTNLVVLFSIPVTITLQCLPTPNKIIIPARRPNVNHIII